MKHHPGPELRRRSLEDRFKEAKEATRFCRIPEARAAYDPIRDHGPRRRNEPRPGRRPAPGWGGFARLSAKIFGDIFRQRVAAAGRPAGCVRDADLRYLPTWRSRWGRGQGCARLQQATSAFRPGTTGGNRGGGSGDRPGTTEGPAGPCGPAPARSDDRRDFSRYQTGDLPRHVNGSGGRVIPKPCLTATAMERSE